MFFFCRCSLIFDRAYDNILSALILIFDRAYNKILNAQSLIFDLDNDNTLGA